MLRGLFGFGFYEETLANWLLAIGVFQEERLGVEKIEASNIDVN